MSMERITDHLAQAWGIDYNETEGILRPLRGFLPAEEED